MSRYPFYLLLLTIHIVVLFKAGNIASSIFSFSIFAFIIGLAFLLINTTNLSRDQKSFQPNRLLKAPFFYLTLFQFWVFFQYVAGISYDSEATFQAFILGCAYSSIALCLSTAISDHRSSFIVFRSIIAMAVFQSLYGAYVLLSGSESILWWPKEHYLEHATGTFVNPNHFAAYLNLSIGLILCSIFHKMNEKRQRKSARLAHKMFFIASTFFSLEGLILVVLLLGVLSSKSIGAITSLLITLPIFSIFILFLSKKVKAKAVLASTSLLLLSLLSLSLFIDTAVFTSELEHLAFTFERRIEISTASLKVATDFWLTGSGAGTFFTVFPAYRDLDVGNAFYYHAHNDYIEFLSDFGLIGLLLLASFVLFALKKNMLYLAKGSDPCRKIFAYASFFATINVAVHSLVDFPLHTTAYALMYICIISINCVDTRQSFQREKAH